MNNLDKQYLDLVQDIINNGVEKKDRTGTGTKSLFGKQIRHKMSEGFPLLTTKKLHWKSIVTELIWFLRGDTNIKYLVDNDVHIWVGDAFNNYLRTYKGNFEMDKEEFINAIKTNDEFAKKWGELGPVYGAGWRNWGGRKTDGFIEYESNGYNENIKGIDQIINLINELKTNPDSRRMLVNAWNVGELDGMVLPPCHYGFQVWTRELSKGERMDYWFKNNKPNRDVCDSVDESSEEEQHKYFDGTNVPARAISLMWNQRSVDVGLGLPFNIASYGLLLEIIAEAVNMVPDELIGNLGDTHLYLNHVEPIKEQLTREPYPLPALSINTEFWQTESGECGVGPIDAIALFNSFSDDNFCKCLLEDDIQLANYQSHPTIKLPLSN